ncbi:MAG: PKD domain-containing protein [Candidatus Binatia bacterium]
MKTRSALRYITQRRLALTMWAVFPWLAINLSSLAAAAPLAVVVNNGGGTFGSGSVTILDLGVVGGAPTPINDASFKMPRWVALTPDNQFAIVSNLDADFLTWIDLTTTPSPTVIGTTVVGSEGAPGSQKSHPKGIAIHGAVAVVAIDDPDPTDADSVAILDLSCLPDCDAATPGEQPPGPESIVKIFSLGTDKKPDGVTITPNGKFALVTQTNGKRFAYVDLKAKKLLGTTSLAPYHPLDVAVTSDSATAVLTNRQDHTVSIVDIGCLPDCDPDKSGNQVPTAAKSTISLQTPRGAATTPDGNAVLIAQGTNPGQAAILHLSDLSNDFLSLAPTKGSFKAAVTATLDGLRLAAITNEDSDSVSILDLNASPVTVLSLIPLPTGSTPRGVAITQVYTPKVKMKVKLKAAPKEGKGPLLVTFDGSESVGTIKSFTMDFGDGSAPGMITSSSPIFLHSYAAVPKTKKFTAILTATDTDGDSAKEKVSITVRENRPPKADFKEKQTKGTLSVAFTDRSKDPDGTILSWSWAFGDGGTSVEQNPVHFYMTSGKFDVTLTITDDSGASAVQQRKISVK